MKLPPSAALMFALLLPGAVLAQTPAPTATPPPLPSGPLLARTPEFSSWQVTRTEAGSPANPPAGKSAPKTPPPKKLVTVVTKTGKIIRVESVDQDGQPISRWCYEGDVYVQQPGWPVPVRFGGPDRLGYYVSYAKSDFPECISVSAKNYTGIKEVLGHQCLTFGGKVETLDDATRLELERSGRTEEIASYHLTDGAAYIDLDSRLPVAVRKGPYVYVYQILPPPTEMQVLPQAISDQIKAELQRENDLTRHPAQS